MFKRSLTVALVLSLAALLLSPLATAAPRTAAGRTASADDPGPPATTPKLVFIHHSVGQNWLADGNGNLGITLRDNNYFVSDTNYGWGTDSIGSSTDIGHWWTWFRGPGSGTYTSELYAESAQHSSYSRLASDPGGENEIVMFKSCYPNSALTGSMSDPVPDIGSNPLRGGSGPLTVANCRGIYNDLLSYFATRPDKLFIVVTAPPQQSLPDGGAPDRAFNNWLVNDWLAGYPYSNVFVFDFYNVLTTNGGDPNTSDLGQAGGNHHRWWSGAVQHKTDGGSNVLAYPTGDDHPSAAGGSKASGEFAALLNVAYHRFKVSPTAPRITSISPTSAHPPATVSIDGFRFGSTRGGSYVSFNGTHATGYTWSDTRITCTAPAGVTSGPVTVTTSNGTSNEALFTVANQTWYLAEGCTGTNSQGSFETWVLVQNPGSSPVSIDMTFQTDSGQIHGPQETVPASSRRSYRVNDYVTSFNVSTRVNADDDVVCERAMYGNGRTWAHDSIGTTSPSTSWYLAEGCTGGGFETWVLVQNPGSVGANVTLTYMTPDGAVPGPTALVPPDSRKTFFVADTVNNAWSVSTTVTADRPVVAERAMYGNNRTWAHESIGTPAPSAEWYLPEGCTRGDFETWVLVQNPGDTPADIDMVFQTESGQVQGPRETIPARTRKTYDAHQYVDSWNVSTRVTATSGQVVCERAMYGNGRQWAHDSIGATAPSNFWCLAEGCSADGYETWVLVQNPGNEDARVTLIYMTASGPVPRAPETVRARSRKTFFVSDTVPGAWDVSTVVSADKPVVCERAMYGNGRTWADDSIGYTP